MRFIEITHPKMYWDTRQGAFMLEMGKNRILPGIMLLDLGKNLTSSEIFTCLEMFGAIVFTLNLVYQHSFENTVALNM